MNELGGHDLNKMLCLDLGVIPQLPPTCPQWAFLWCFLQWVRKGPGSKFWSEARLCSKLSRRGPASWEKPDPKRNFAEWL